VPLRAHYDRLDQPTGFGWVAVEAIESDPSAPEEKVQPRHAETLEDVVRALPLLAEKKLSIALAIQAFKLRDQVAMERWFDVVKLAIDQHGVQVRPWLLLDFQDGYFPNATNHESFLRHARELVRQWKAHELPPTTLVVDMEPSRALQAALSSADFTQALPRQHVDRERYARAQAAFASFVRELKQQGFGAMLTTLPMILTDYHDGDDDLRQYFGVVIDGVEWEQIDFQLYRSLFEAQAPRLGPDFVFQYVREAQGRFPGMKLGFDLGLTHPGPISQDAKTLEKPAALREDVEAALAAGADPQLLSVYNLQGILRGAPRCPKLRACAPDEYQYLENEPGDWLAAPSARLSPPAPSSATDHLSLAFTALDKLF
jgi:hypothetical protein